MRAAHLEIDTVALQHNLRRIRSIVPGCKVLAMVKANAYGHGFETIAKALPEADAFGVACIEEAIILRQAGVTNPIVLMEGFFDAAELTLMREWNLVAVIHHFAQIAILENQPFAKPINVWLKIDTGMNRLGFTVEQVPMAWQRLNACPLVSAIDCIMTHFSEPDALDKNTTQRQFEQFMQATSAFPGLKSLANSAAILGWPATSIDWVRPGIILYGVSPFANRLGTDFGLKPVMTLRSEIIAIRQARKGDAIGYGSGSICADDMPIGVVAMGYGDGYPRHARNGTPVLVNNTTVPLIGRVSMDMLTVDLSTVPQTQVGDSVTLWGAGLPIEIVAAKADTIAYELLCAIARGSCQRVKIAIKSDT